MNKIANKGIGLVLALALVVTPWSMASAQGRATAGPAAAMSAEQAAEYEAWLTRIVPMLSGALSFSIANRLGMTAIRGKKLNVSPIMGPDAPVGTSPGNTQNEPSIAVNLEDDRQVVSAMHNFPTGTLGVCTSFRSSDGGVTWAGPTALPLVVATDTCADPVVRWAPDGSRVYASYMSVFTGAPCPAGVTAADIVVSTSTDGGATWSAPVVASSFTCAGLADKPWLGVHHFDATGGNAGRVYVTHTQFDNPPAPNPCTIRFTRSADFGATWSAPITLATSADCPGGANPVLQGSNVIGGLGGNLLVCWYNSEADGWLTGFFDIRCRSSANNGTTFNAEVTAANNVNRELPFALCPNGSLHRWWGGMFPRVAIAPNGSAHVVFASDPTAGVADGECGAIRYVRSAAPPYAAWVAPATISSGANTALMAEGYPAISIRQRPLNAFDIYVSWEDHRLSPTSPVSSRNLLYDTFYTVSTNGGLAWAPNTRLSDVSSLSEDLFIGDYTENSSSRRTTHVIWTDRADKLSIFDREDDVMADRICNPAPCP